MNPNGLISCGRRALFHAASLLIVFVLLFFLASCASVPNVQNSSSTSALREEGSTAPADVDPPTTWQTTSSCSTETTLFDEPKSPCVREEKNESLRAIPYETIYEYSDLYYKGDRVVRRNGVAGCERVVTVMTYEDDILTNTQTYTERLYSPSDAIVIVGTRDPITYETIVTREDSIHFPTIYELDDTRYDDEQIVFCEGNDGYTETKWRITFDRGQEISREVIATLVKEPMPCMVRVGTKPAQKTETCTEKENEIPYGTQYIYDETLEEGIQKTEITGRNGYTEVVYRITYYHDEETSKEPVRRTVHEPLDEVVRIGTKKEETFGLPFLPEENGGNRNLVTQAFGGANSHGGIDLGVWYGNTIVAAKSGTVIYAFHAGDLPKTDLRWTYGTFVVIEHDDGIRTYYAHMRDRTVSVGDHVEKGDVVGHSGNTGRVSPMPTAENPLAGTHLHFEVRIRNAGQYVKVDPRNYLPPFD